MTRREDADVAIARFREIKSARARLSATKNMDGYTIGYTISAVATASIIAQRLLTRTRKKGEEGRRQSLEMRASKVFAELKDVVPVSQPLTPFCQALELLTELRSMLEAGDAAMRDKLGRAIDVLTLAQRRSSSEKSAAARDAALQALLAKAPTNYVVGVRQYLGPELDDTPRPPMVGRFKTVARSIALSQRVVHPAVKNNHEAELGQILEHGVLEWEFDSVRLSTLTGGHPLLALCWALCERHGLRDKLGFTSESLLSFFSEVENSYKRVPYHNAQHACDVTHALHWLVTTNSLGACAAEPLDVFIAIVAAAGHDANHDGRNNDFHNKTHSEYALTHAYSSPLERHHLATTFRLLEKTNLLEPLAPSDRQRVRERLVALILATDFASHKHILDSFSDMVAAEESSDNFQEMRAEEQLLCLKMAIKLADLSYLSKGKAYVALWTDRVLEEFFNQGDAEKAAGFEITKGFDRATHSAGLPRIGSQLGFIGFMVLPLYKSLMRLVPELAEPTASLQAVFDDYEVQKKALA